MKVSVMIVDTVNEITQYGTIEEPVIKGCEIVNALKHFGVINSEVEWTMVDSNGKWEFKFGIVKDTTKIVNVVAYKNGKESKLIGKVNAEYDEKEREMLYPHLPYLPL